MTYNAKNWTSGASCAGIGVDGFYPPEKGRDTSKSRIAQVCAACPVRLFCLADGLGDRWGVWGGAGPRDRARMIHKLSPPAVQRLKEAIVQYAATGEDADQFEAILDSTNAPARAAYRTLMFHPTMRKAAG